MDGQQAQEKKLNITDQQGNASQDHNEMSSYTCQKSSEKPRNNNSCEEKGTLMNCLWKCKLGQPLWKTVWRFLKKLKIELLYDLNSTPGYLSEENENTNLKRYMHPNIHSSIIYNSQDMEAT